MDGWTPELKLGSGPIYLAIAAALVADIRAGRLRAGDGLPPQRELARRLGIDLTTVTRAFNEVRRQGLIGAGGRRGTFVLGPGGGRPMTPPPAAPVAPDWRMNLPPTPEGMHLTELLGEGFRAVLSAPDAVGRLQYQEAGGALPDRLAGARWLKPRLGDVAEDRLVLAAGAQHALACLGHLLLSPGDVVATGEVTFPGLKEIASRAGIGLVSIAGDRGGLDPDAFDRLCWSQRPRALYCVPTMDNPTTATLDAERREALATVARRHGVWVVEDDAYGDLPDAPIPAIARFAPERTWHIASLAKSVSPALRLAYVAVPDTAEGLRLGDEIHATCVMAPPINAALASLWIGEGRLGAIIDTMRQENRARQAVLAEALAGFDLAGDPNAPHAWLRLPAGQDREAFAARLRQEGLAAVSSDAFAVAGSPQAAVRLSLGSSVDLGALARAARLAAALLAGSARPARSII